MGASTFNISRFNIPHSTFAIQHYRTFSLLLRPSLLHPSPSKLRLRERPLRPFLHARRADHPADRVVVWAGQGRSADGRAAALHRRGVLLGRVADGADEAEVKYTVVLTADYPSVAREILAGEF